MIFSLTFKSDNNSGKIQALRTPNAQKNAVAHGLLGPRAEQNDPGSREGKDQVQEAEGPPQEVEGLDRCDQERCARQVPRQVQARERSGFLRVAEEHHEQASGQGPTVRAQPQTRTHQAK